MDNFAYEIEINYFSYVSPFLRILKILEKANTHIPQ
jgi:hypothetical protein